MMAKRSKKLFFASVVTLACYGCMLFGHFLYLPYLMKHHNAAFESLLVRSLDFGAATAPFAIVGAGQLFSAMMPATINASRHTR
jgi:hypothetical protein